LPAWPNNDRKTGVEALAEAASATPVAIVEVRDQAGSLDLLPDGRKRVSRQLGRLRMIAGTVFQDERMPDVSAPHAEGHGGPLDWLPPRVSPQAT